MNFYIKFFGLFVTNASLILFSNIHAMEASPSKIPTLLEKSLNVLAQECLSAENPKQFFYETKGKMPSDLHDVFEKAIRKCVVETIIKYANERRKKFLLILGNAIIGDDEMNDVNTLTINALADMPTDEMLASIKTLPREIIKKVIIPELCRKKMMNSEFIMFNREFFTIYHDVSMKKSVIF